MSRKKLYTVLVIAASLIFAVVNIILLPDEVGMQLTSEGTLGNVMPKPVAIVIPLALSGVGLYIMNKSEKILRPLLFACVGAILQPLTLIINLLAKKGA